MMRNLDNQTKSLVVLLIALSGMWVCKRLQHQHNNEMVFGDVAVSKSSCAYGINSLVPGAVDSIKVCECLLPAFYTLVKDKPALMDQFRENKSFFTLPDSLQHIYEQQMATCIRENILDSNAVIVFSPGNAAKFKHIIKQGLESRKEFANLNTEAVSNCMVEKLNGHISVLEYFSMQIEGGSPTMDSIVLACIALTPPRK